MTTAVSTTPRTVEEAALRLVSESSIEPLALSSALHGLAEEPQVSWLLAGSRGTVEGVSEYLVSLGVNVMVSDHLSAGELLSAEAILRSPAVTRGTVAQEIIVGTAFPTEKHLISRALRSLGAHWHAQMIVDVGEQAGPDDSVRAVTQYLANLADQVDAEALRKRFDQMVAERRAARR